MFKTPDEQLYQICCTLDEISNISPPQATDSPHPLQKIQFRNFLVLHFLMILSSFVQFTKHTVQNVHCTVQCRLCRKVPGYILYYIYCNLLRLIPIGIKDLPHSPPCCCCYLNLLTVSIFSPRVRYERIGI